MNDPENFLTRWSRRKRETADAPVESDRSSNDRPGAAGESQPGTAAEAAEPLFDLTQLPSIESITAETDIRAFFAPGVPADLRLAALRRVWVADPKIKDFVGLADYDFDFNTPGAIPGFGPLEMSDEVRRQVAQIVGDLRPDEEPARPAGAPSRPVQPTGATEEINAGPAGPQEVPGSLVSPRSDDRVGSPVELRGHPVLTHRSEDDIAPQQEIKSRGNLPVAARRTHGGALPK
jgi:hypothetical protein